MNLHRPKPRPWFAATAWMIFLASPGLALADSLFETVYLTTSSIYTVPTTSSILATSYVVPTASSSTYIPTTYTSSYIPTTYTSSYIPTSYTSTIIPTSTVVATDAVLVPTTTTYYRPSIFRSRRFVERTSYAYAPTSYLLPTTYLASALVSPTSYVIDNGVVTTSLDSSPCETAPSAAPTRATSKPQTTKSSPSNGAGIISEPTNATVPTERRPSATYNSLPSDESGKPSDVVPPVPANVQNQNPPTQTPPSPAASTPVDKAPLPQPGPLTGSEGTNPSAQPSTPASDGGLSMPPPGKIGIPTNPNETSYRQVRRPAYDSRNILRGKVVSADSNLPAEGVTLIISSATQKFLDKQAMTDADGEFKVSLPDGDWTVKVKMPSGRVFTVGQDYVTASSGRITDPSGRPVGMMQISR